jgi:hypothetical protein
MERVEMARRSGTLADERHADRFILADCRGLAV